MEKFSDNNFQVINMNYKLKKIKKNKKHKNNYKNIEIFETLENRQNDNIDTNKQSKINEHFESGSSVIEGFPDSYYDGIDNINKTRKDLSGYSLVDFIERIYQYLIRINQIIAEKVAITLSNNKILSIDQKTKIDNIYHIRQYIVWTESILAAAYVTYNMYFIMYYKDVEEIKLIDISLDQARKIAEGFPILHLFLYIFEYSISTLETFNNFITIYIPKATKSVLNSTFVFAIIFIILIFFIKYSAVYFKNFLIDTLNMNFNFFSLLIYFYVFVLWLGAVYKTGMEKANVISQDPNKLVAADICLFLFNRTVKLILSMMIGVPAILFFIICYILIYTFVAIFFYIGFDMDIFKRIDEYVKITKNGSVESICDNPSWFDIILEYTGIKLIMGFLQVIYNKLFTIAFIILYIVCSIRYSEIISPKAGNLKNSLIFINIMIIIILGAMVGKEYMKDFVNI
jgi:hypothetical protein